MYRTLQRWGKTQWIFPKHCVLVGIFHEGGFLDDDEDFNRELESATTAEENVEGKKVHVCEIFRKETLKHTGDGTSKTEKKPKKTVSPPLQISQFEETVKECVRLCHGDSCLPEDIRNMFGFFEFDRQDAVDLWEILEPVITKFHGDAEKFIVLFMVYCKKIYCPINLVEILP